MPETLKDVIRALPCDGATTVAFLGALPVALLDAHVYRSCPECGGSRLVPDPETVELGDDGEFHIDNLEMLPCPACADAPTAIVSAALREKCICIILDMPEHIRTEKGARIEMDSWEGGFGTDDWWESSAETVDAVLSTVLVHVRYSKGERSAVRQRRHTGSDGTEYKTDAYRFCYKDGPQALIIAILEEAGKEE